MTIEAIIERIRESQKTGGGELSQPAPRRINAKVERNHLIETLRFLKDQLGFSHLATITGVDLGENFEVLYHLANSDAVVTVRVLTPRAEPKIPSVTPVIPGAILYERELQDMFGLVVDGIPDPRPLLLPDDWPQGQFPLRKDWKHVRAAEVIPGGE
jgi:membrane-bound hydrogenase subunit beta